MSSYLSTAVKIKLKPDGTENLSATPSAATALTIADPPKLMLGISKRSSYSLMLSYPTPTRMMTLDIKDFILTSCSKFLST
jgi:hypothetical protein